MPEVMIPGVRLRENNIRTPQDLLRVYAPALIARGFRLKQDGPDHRRVWITDPPAGFDQREENNVYVSQDVPDRIPNNAPGIWHFLQRIAAVDVTAVQPLLALLLSEGDDRAATIQAIEVIMPENLTLSEDFGQATDGHSEKTITSEQMANRILCGKILLLFGLRQEPL